MDMVRARGEFKDMTVPNEIEDAKKVVEYVRDLRYVSTLAIAGHSQGGVVAAMTAGQLSEELGEPAFKAVALMAPAAVLRDDAIRGNTMGKQYDPFDPGEYVELWGGLKLGGKYIRTAFSLPIYETAAKYQGPALVIHGNADRVVPYTYGERFHQIWPKSELVIQEYFDHGFSQDIYRTTDIVAEYLMKQLKQEPGFSKDESHPCGYGSLFAAVEQRDNPELKGKPIAVAKMPNEE